MDFTSSCFLDFGLNPTLLSTELTFHLSQEIGDSQTSKMKSFSPLMATRALVLSSVVLFLLLKFEPLLHDRFYWFLTWIAFALAGAALLFRTLRGRAKVVLFGLWICILFLTAMDFWRTATLTRSSAQLLNQEIDRSTRTIQDRARELLETSRVDYRRVQEALENVSPFTRENVFVQLENSLSGSGFWWGVYDSDRKLIAWNGQLPLKEASIEPDKEDVSVLNLLHQQFLKYKKTLRHKNNTLFLVVLRPFATEFGIENRYLGTFNRLTDDLAIHPYLLYNSEQSTTTSPDLTIRTVQVTKDFTISALYEKGKYGEYLQSRFYRLHWWLELSALLFFVSAVVFLFFQFAGLSGNSDSNRVLASSWFGIAAVSVLAILGISEFTALSMDHLFKSSIPGGTGIGRLFRSPGNVFFNAFFCLATLFSLALLLWKTAANVFSKRNFIQYLTMFGAFFGAQLLLYRYYELVRKALEKSVVDLIDFSSVLTNIEKGSLILGTLWLDLGFTLLIGIIFALVVRKQERNLRNFIVFLVLQVAGWFACFFLYQNRVKVPTIPSMMLYFGVGILVFFLPLLWRRFERINLLSRFIVTVLSFSIVSSIFYFTRFQYAESLQKSYVEREAATQVKGQEGWIREVLRVSQGQLDVAIQNLSLDPRIPDLAYRLWSRTDFARFGYKSAVEIYDQNGGLLNRFALNLPRLALNSAPIPGGEIWETDQNTVSFGNSRKLILVSVRTLPEIGFLVVQALQDYRNLPFVASTNPFQELFRPMPQVEDLDRMLFLNVYDASWHPVFVSDADFSPAVPRALNLLRNASSEWITEEMNNKKFHAYYFRMNRGFGSILLPAVSFRTHLVHLIDLLLINLLWLSVFGAVLLAFFKRHLTLHFPAHAPTGFNFFQKLMLAFVVFSMVPMVFLSLFIRNYVREKKVDEVTSSALTSFSVAAKVVGDYLLYKTEQQNPETTGQIFSDELLEWISQVIQQDVSLYNDRNLLATSYREFFSAALLGQRIPARAYGDLFLESKLYSISEGQIGELKFLNVSGRVHYMEHTKAQTEGEERGMEVITIPFLIDEQAVQAEIVGLREYMMLVGAGLILFAVFLGYFLANRFSRPVQVLIHGTGEMARGYLDYRIREQYQDEFSQLIESFNSMAGSLNEQRQALERRREYIENILKNITSAVISIDRNMLVTTVNPAAESMFGIDPLYHRLLENLIPSGGPWEPVHGAIAGMVSDRTRYQAREITVAKEKEELSLRLVYVPLFENKEWNGAVLLIEDVSDIIRSKRLAAFAEMARQVAHEVKNPLTPIQLATEHLVKVYEDRSENFSDVLKSSADSILRQVKTLRRLVSDFSQYGRPSLLNRSVVDLPAFLEELSEHYRQHLPDGIRMEINLDEELPSVKVDPEKIRSAFMNVIENGLQAMNGQGRICLKAEKGENGFVAIRISDTGKGVPAEVLPRMFEPYFSTKAGGTGLGLAIARKNIEDHGGKIEIESKVNQGTTVTILLPASSTT